MHANAKIVFVPQGSWPESNHTIQLRYMSFTESILSYIAWSQPGHLAAVNTSISVIWANCCMPSLQRALNFFRVSNSSHFGGSSSHFSTYMASKKTAKPGSMTQHLHCFMLGFARCGILAVPDLVSRVDLFISFMVGSIIHNLLQARLDIGTQSYELTWSSRYLL